MRKRPSPLRLHRETLRNLTTPQLRAAAGGSSPYSDEGASCEQSCFFNTCYEGCPWPVRTNVDVGQR
jgi:hypothetical protein